MGTELSSLIKLDQVSKHYYKPATEIELASLTRYEKVYTKILETPDEGCVEAALDVAEQIKRNVTEKGRCVIAFGSGRGALQVYDELVKLYFADKVSFSNVVAFNMAEFGLGATDNQEQSTLRRIKERLFNKVDIDPENIHTFDTQATKENVHRLCKLYETEIDEYGGLDLVICQLAKNGGLVFNEPGSSSSSSCRLVLLSNETRTRVAESYQCEDAPATAVTLGISNILSAHKVICVAWGENSADALYSTIEGNLTDQIPASFLQLHHNVKMVVDLEAAHKLTRINFPWKVASCEWTDQLVRRAIVWLSQHTGKPILKLTNKDYNDNGLSELVTVFGSGYDVNIRIFNDLQHTITGWPGGKPNADDTYRPERATPYPKRVLVFSPHPDDVVVSMGGTLRRLVQQGHDVHVAFQTSGDLTVSDENLVRLLMLQEKVTRRFNLNSDNNFSKRFDELSQEMKNKKLGDPDSPTTRYLKGMIFVCEGIMSCMHMGVKRENIYELNMPFYDATPSGDGKVTSADVELVKKQIAAIQPHQIFFADDLNDPFDTHAKVAEAIVAALSDLRHESFMRDCRVWMYRGQWGAFSIDDIEMTVPMSPEEFSYKRDAILKHQSQIHDAPFRDPENGKLSWQRSIDRNKATADLYSSLGLASYEAMEAFVQFKLPQDEE